MAAEYDNINIQSLKDPLEYLSSKSSSLPHLSKTILSEIIDLIKNLDEKKASGFDLISNKVLKASCLVIAPFLEILFNLCISKGVLCVFKNALCYAIMFRTLLKAECELCTVESGKRIAESVENTMRLVESVF